MVGEFQDCGLARQKSAGHKNRRGLAYRVVSFALTTWAFVSFALSQAAPAPAQDRSKPSVSRTFHQKQKPDPPLIAEPSPQPAPPPAPPPVLTPEQMPPRTPEVVWDGKMLSINAENSTLADILVAVRARTGAEIDLPPSAGRERMAARLGPAPVREVLTSLLSGTDYDYIIQASETDDNGIRSVILTPRGKGEDLPATATAGIRRGPGYTASGQHTFEVWPDTSTTTSKDLASTAAAEPAVQPAESAEPASAAAQPASTDLPPQSDSNSSPASSLASSGSPTVGRGLLPGIDPNGEPPTMGQMVQGMQQLYEQRRQIQAQQNQAQQNRAAPPTN